MIPFEKTKKELWIQFPDKTSYLENEQIVYGYLADSEGEDEVVIYCARERAIKRLPKNRSIQILSLIHILDPRYQCVITVGYDYVARD